MWILELQFLEDHCRREYCKMNVASENNNENVEIIVKYTDKIRKNILKKLAMVREGTSY